MGRQFEYNRFDNDEDIKQEVGASDCKQKEFLQKSQSPQTNKKSKSLKKYDTRICPPYSELYPDEHDIPLKDETTTKRTKSTRKSVEIAIKKYHQLSKFLIQSQNDDVTTNADTDTNTATGTTATLMEKDDCEMIAMAASVPKKPKVYDCMRDFLRKKFFHHTVSEEESEEAVEYDEVDYLTMMEDSYDIKDVDDDEDEDDECLLVVTSNHQTRSKCIRLVEGGCWPKSDFYLEDGDEVDSDVGIKDCCQLLGGSPKTEKNGKSPKRKPITEMPSELRDAPWFQPNISGKAAAEKLSKEDPGAFIIRQSSSVKPGNYILSPNGDKSEEVRYTRISKMLQN